MKLLSEATTFTDAFFRRANAAPPPADGARPATAWFEGLMLALAKEHGLHCQNLKSDRPGEWMKVDHVFVEQNTYAHFPIVVVEHENGDLGAASKRGVVPHGDERGTFIEWAAWKALTMQAKLHVLVAYPRKGDKVNALGVLSRMVEAYAMTYGIEPNVLFLLGWWDLGPVRLWRAENLYVPYAPTKSADGKLRLDELHLIKRALLA